MIAVLEYLDLDHSISFLITIVVGKVANRQVMGNKEIVNVGLIVYYNAS